MHSQRMGVPQGSPSDKWLSAKRRKWIPFKPALTDLAEHRVSDHFRHAIPFPRRGSTWWRFRMRRIVTTRSAEELRRPSPSAYRVDLLLGSFTCACRGPQTAFREDREREPRSVELHFLERPMHVSHQGQSCLFQARHR